MAGPDRVDGRRGSADLPIRGAGRTVQASCDQLDATVRDTQSWVDDHRCPDTKFGLYVAELISASRGMGAIMLRIIREAPDGNWIDDRSLADEVGAHLMDRIAQASRARLYLRQWSV